MRICQVLASSGMGGLERHFIELCDEMSLAYDIHAIASDLILSKISDRVKKYPLDMSGWRLNPFTRHALSKYINRIEPDVLHAQANKAAAMCSTFARKVPCAVATVHNQKKQIQMYEKYDEIIAVSKEAGEKLNGRTVNVVWNGIKPSGKKYQRPDDVPNSYVLSVGRLVRVKGFERLINHWERRSEILLIAGDGPDMKPLENIITEKGLSSKVKLLGFREDIPALMQHSDVLAIPSFKEGFPYVLVEALHAQCRVISTTIPGAETFLPEQALINIEDFSNFDAALDYALLNDSASDYKRSWLEAELKLTLATMCRETISVYEKCLLSR